MSYGFVDGNDQSTYSINILGRSGIRSIRSVALEGEVILSSRETSTSILCYSKTVDLAI